MSRQMTQNGKLYISMGSIEAKLALIRASQQCLVNVTDYVRLLIAEELDLDFNPEQGFTRSKASDGNLNLSIGAEWKERAMQVREKVGKGLASWIKEMIDYEEPSREE